MPARLSARYQPSQQLTALPKPAAPISLSSLLSLLRPTNVHPRISAVDFSNAHEFANLAPMQLRHISLALALTTSIALAQSFTPVREQKNLSPAAIAKLHTLELLNSLPAATGASTPATSPTANPPPSTTPPGHSSPRAPKPPPTPSGFAASSKSPRPSTATTSPAPASGSSSAPTPTAPCPRSSTSTAAA